MKLNFEYCKKCNSRNSFAKYSDSFIFYCGICGYFVFDIKEYDIKKYKHCKYKSCIELKEITDEEWSDIKKMKIVDYDHEWFKNCPYKLEHIVENEE